MNFQSSELHGTAGSEFVNRARMTETAEETAIRHTIPVLDRTMEVLGQIERSGDGLTIRELTEALGLPRTTIYRILNTLQHHQVVRRDERGAYHLGRRLLSLAAHVAARASDIDLAAIGQPLLDRLAAELGEGVKLSVIDPEGILVLAAAQGRREYALTVAPGQRMPVHAGAASKLLLAHLPAQGARYWLASRWPPTRRRRSPSRDACAVSSPGSGGRAGRRTAARALPSIQAFAAPVFTRDGRMVAAISVPFLAGTPPARDGGDPPRRHHHRPGSHRRDAGLTGCASPTSAARSSSKSPIVRIVTDEGLSGYGQAETWKPLAEAAHPGLPRGAGRRGPAPGRARDAPHPPARRLQALGQRGQRHRDGALGPRRQGRRAAGPQAARRQGARPGSASTTARCASRCGPRAGGLRRGRAADDGAARGLHHHQAAASASTGR